MSRWFRILALWSVLSHGGGPPESTAAEVSYRLVSRVQKLNPPSGDRVGFTTIQPEASGVYFTNQLSRERYLTNQIYLNGSGVAVGDVDGDGWCDLYFCNLDGGNRLFRNLGGWKFENVTAAAGVGADELDATGAAFADLDGDGDLDLIVNSVGQGTWVFFNDGHGHFQRSAILNLGRGGMSLALADIDGDGDLDLYVANYRTVSVRDEPNTRFELNREGGRVVIQKVNGRPVTDPALVGRFHVGQDGKVVEDGEPDALFLNDGKGNFTPVSFTDGTFTEADGKPLTSPPYDWGLSVLLRDLNGDGAPDIYVCNDFESPDRIWINDGKGKFRALPRQSLRSTSMFSMGIDIADFNRDGLDDIFVADMRSRTHLQRNVRVPDLPASYAESDALSLRHQYSMNTLLLNRGGGLFSEVAFASGVSASDWSWTPAFLDVDLDGYEDLLITTGHEMEMMNMDVIGEAEQRKSQKVMSPRELLDLRRLFPRLASPKVAFRNRGDSTFEDVGAAWGFDSPGVSHGMALADLDNDGDLDVVINNLNDGASLLRNDAQASRLAVSLRGNAPNTRGIGASLRLRGGPVVQSQQMVSGGRYLSSDDAMRSFAAGAASNLLTLEVTWRNGRQTVISNVAPNQRIDVFEADSSADAPPTAAPAQPLFSDVSAKLGHRHQDTPFNDFQRQPLLPRKLSQLGPGVAWHDIDGDGWEDLIVGAGRGGVMSVFRNEGGRGFAPLTNGVLARKLPRDQSGIVGVGSTLFAGASNYEDGQTNGGCIRIYDIQRGAAGDSILGVEFSSGPLAMADIDGDGDLDLFVGGRCVAGRYPEPATSYLLRNDGGRMSIIHRFERLGMVSGAVFTDLDGDGSKELVVACDWGPVRVFGDLATRPRERTESLGLTTLTGNWNGIAVGDFDEDGRLDLVVSNWGRNHPHAEQGGKGNRLFYGDLTEEGTVHCIEAYYDLLQSKVVPYRNLMTLSRALPFVRERMQGFRQYGESSVAEILGDRFALLKELSVATLDSTLLLNRGDHFVASSLPWEAQLSPAFGLSVSDLDGDGHEDIFLSQNFFGTIPETPIQASGLGLWLRGDGKGHFTAVSPSDSGIRIFGEQRGCAVADYDADGRVDLVVTQNSGLTKLYHNDRARPGLRVRLIGDAGNTAAIGAVLQLSNDLHKGYSREIHAGAGYWSLDGAVQVMTLSDAPNRITVRWPGGRSTVTPIKAGATELTLSSDGKEGVR